MLLFESLEDIHGWGWLLGRYGPELVNPLCNLLTQLEGIGLVTQGLQTVQYGVGQRSGLTQAFKLSRSK
jgi:hypothetical protein